MIIFKKAALLSNYIQSLQAAGKTIGFVPTMGALHDGHLSLLALAKRENDIAVCSIFVNPTQFNNAEDFKHYPVTIEKDVEQLIKATVDVLFLPSVDEIYPNHYAANHYDLGPVETLLEGFYRPGHFQGVCQVIDQLLQIVHPDKLYLGQKDYQQCMVISKLLQLLHKENEVQLRIAPTIREQDGLAMSSRNLRLSGEERKHATAIFKALNYIKAHLHTISFDQLLQHATKQLEAEGFTVDYITIADARNLNAATTTTQPLVALAAASIGNIRLIDNLLLN